MIGIPRVLSYFNDGKKTAVEIQQPLNRIIQVTAIAAPEIKKIKKQILIKTVAEKPLEITLTKQLVNPTIVQAQLAAPDIATNNKKIQIQQSTNEGTGITNSNSSQGNGINNTAPTEYGNTVVTAAILDKLPEFPGGIAKFCAYIGKTFETPVINGEKSIRIYVSFVVEKDGSMNDIQVKNDPGYGFAREPIRVLKSLRTKWSPGMIASKPVRTSYNVPLRFR
ncbi:MAG: protein TonB [Flavobacterium sp.]